MCGSSQTPSAGSTSSLRSASAPTSSPERSYVSCPSGSWLDSSCFTWLHRRVTARRDCADVDRSRIQVTQVRPSKQEFSVTGISATLQTALTEGHRQGIVSPPALSPARCSQPGGPGPPDRMSRAARAGVPTLVPHPGAGRVHRARLRSPIGAVHPSRTTSRH
eukprot:930089-Rhodomonas_salina.1